MRRRFLRRLPLLTLLAAALAFQPVGAAQPETPSAVHPSTDPVKQELTAVIDAQLAAFRANDYPKAYTFAAGAIQGMFSRERFEEMVKTAYPVIAGSAKAEYGLAFDTGEEAVVNVTVENAGGKRVQYQYLLKKEDGAWKINGVAEMKSEGLSV